MKSKIKFKSNKNFFILVIMTIILFVIFTSLNFFSYKVKSKYEISNISSNINNNVKTEIINAEPADKSLTTSTITIPDILLYDAPIKEGVDELTLNEYVGHFPSTSENYGNIGLAAHNRGYKNNYFMNLYKIKIGDEIIYKLNNKSRLYKVVKKIEIDSYDWSYLDSTKDNTITLITCIDNKPDKRLLVQAVE